MKTTFRLIMVAAVIVFVGTGAILWLKSTYQKAPTAQSESALPSVPNASRSVVASPERALQVTAAQRPLPKLFEQIQSGSLLAPVLPASNESLDLLSGTVVTSSGSRKLTGSEGLFDRVMIAEGEQVTVHLDLPNLKPGKEVTIAASNGGRIQRINGPLQFVAKSPSTALELAFTPTLGRGAYSIDIRHAGSVATLSFWAGPPLLAGQPGPNFIPLPPPSETIP